MQNYKEAGHMVGRIREQPSSAKRILFSNESTNRQIIALVLQTLKCWCVLCGAVRVW
jgi:hypothetical protein